MLNIHYISFFLDEDEMKGRQLEVAAQSKINYLIFSLKEIGVSVQIVSTALGIDKSGYSKKKIHLMII